MRDAGGGVTRVCCGAGATQSLSVRLARMAIQANDFLREYTAYAAPAPGKDAATATTPGISAAAPSPLHGASRAMLARCTCAAPMRQPYRRLGA